MIKGSNKYKELAESIKGIYTVQTLGKRLKINEKKAIYVIYRLRKLGYVKTSYGQGKKRLYYISMDNLHKRISYTQRINEISPIKLASSNPYYIYGRIPSIEETLIYAIKQKEVRYIIASLALFKKVKYWALLYKLAKKEGLVREVVALYEVSKIVVKKVKRMPKRFYNLALQKKSDSYIYIIKGLNSSDFKEIEKKWKVYIPLNREDLGDYKHD
ncbi:hypothetical protein AUJ62_00415 [Candidatus Pacearchaeota archaeon CG1_02_32_21]|nr:MAG: hypothetical protein AUJ62_00415 [Candidatus Pacearchaeota archaeon CG1_02_32_21]